MTISHRLLMLKIIYIKDLALEHPMTQITYINILANIQLMRFYNYRINKTRKANKTYYGCNSDVVVNKHNTINTNGTYNVSKTFHVLNITDNNYYTKKNSNTSNIANNITRHNHNNYEHNVVIKIHKHKAYEWL